MSKEKSYDLPPAFSLNDTQPNFGKGSHYGWGFNGEMASAESWRPITLYRTSRTTYEIAEGYYVSDRGNVISTRQGCKQLKPDTSTKYARVKLLCKDGTRHWCLVHRLVLDAWLRCPDVIYKLLKFVNHRDGEKLNNVLPNLEYSCPVENVRHYWDVLRPLIEKQDA